MKFELLYRLISLDSTQKLHAELFEQHYDIRATLQMVYMYK